MLDVRQYQLVREPDFLRVRIVPRDSAPDNLSARDRDAIADQLAEAGAAPTRILVEQVDELERDPGHAAKLKLVTSA
jgi:type IV pilus biogenesis protein CpaD/CtpE